MTRITRMKQAFTLIETMEVIAIVALLALLILVETRAADELTLVTNLNYRKGNDALLRNVTQSVTVDGTVRLTRFISVTTSTQQVNLADVTSPGFCFIRNQATNATFTAYFSREGTNVLFAVEANEPALLRLTSTNLFVVGNTNLTVEINLLPD